MKPQRVIRTAVLAGVVVLVVTALATQVTGDPAGVFTRDVRAVAYDEGVDLAPYVGAVSQLTVIVWAMGAALAFCVAALVPTRQVWAGVLGMLLFAFAADDALMLHETAGEQAHVLEYVIFGVYAAVALWLFVTSLRFRNGAETLGFAIGASFMAVSGLIDVTSHGQYFAEDGAKLLAALVLLTVPISALTPPPSLPRGRAAFTDSELEAISSRLTVRKRHTDGRIEDVSTNSHV